MASLSRIKARTPDGKHGWRIQFMDGSATRRSIYLGGVPKKVAQSWALRGFPWLQSVDGRTGSRMGKCMADGVISGAETHCIHLQRLPFPLCFPTIGLLGPAWRRGGAAGAGTSTFPGVKPTIFRDPGPLATKFPEEPKKS